MNVNITFPERMTPKKRKKLITLYSQNYIGMEFSFIQCTLAESQVLYVRNTHNISNKTKVINPA